MNGGRRRAHSASQTGGGVEGSEEEMAVMRQEVENLTQELRDLKLVLERVGTLSPRTPRDIAPTPFPNTHPENSHYVTAEVHSTGVGTRSASNGTVVSAFSEGDTYPGTRPGEARVFVDDHREAWARSNPRDKPPSTKPLFGNVRVQRQITVPEPNYPPGPANGHALDGSVTIQRRVVREPVLVQADSGRKLSSTHSLWHGGTGGAKMAPLSARHPQDRQHYFRSMRVSRHSGIPSTIVRPIEETYAHGRGHHHTLRRHPVVLVQSQVPYSLQEGVQDVYIAQQPTQPSGAVYVSHGSRSVTPTSSMRRSSSPAKVRQDMVQHHHNGDLDDVLL